MKKRKKSLLGHLNSVRCAIKMRAKKKKNKAGAAASYHYKTQWAPSKMTWMTRMRTTSTEKHRALLQLLYKEASCSSDVRKTRSKTKLREAFPSTTDLPHARYLMMTMTRKVACNRTRVQSFKSKSWPGSLMAKNNQIKISRLCSQLVIARSVIVLTTTYRLTHQEALKVQSFLTSSQSTAMKILPTILRKKVL